jgi:hypothetical protein
MDIIDVFEREDYHLKNKVVKYVTISEKHLLFSFNAPSRNIDSLQICLCKNCKSSLELFLKKREFTADQIRPLLKTISGNIRWSM